MSVDAVIELLKADDSKKRDEWERTRQLCFYSVAPHSKIRNAKDLFALPWDKKEQKPAKKLSKKQHEKKMKQAEKYLPKILK